MISGIASPLNRDTDMKYKETVYRSPDGQRWRLSSSPKYDNKTMAVRIKDGRVRWKNDDLDQLVEESLWLKQQKETKV